jgi:hypothetical protein
MAESLSALSTASFSSSEALECAKKVIDNIASQLTADCCQAAGLTLHKSSEHASELSIIDCSW